MRLQAPAVDAWGHCSKPWWSRNSPTAVRDEELRDALIDHQRAQAEKEVDKTRMKNRRGG
jgi:hypothetical protein